MATGRLSRRRLLRGWLVAGVAGLLSVPGAGRLAAASPAPPPTLAPSPPARPPAPRPPTRWGIGVYGEGREIMEALVLTRPGCILLNEPGVGWAQAVRARFPRAFIVGRRHEAGFLQPLDDPETRGRAWADFVGQLAIPLRGVVDAWQGYNETAGHNDYATYALSNRFQVAFAQRLREVAGVAVVAGNDAAGVVEPEDYPRYFAEAIAASDYFGVHAYSKPGARSLRADAEWYALRYRKIHAALEAAGLRGVPMVLTETGIAEGWRDRVDGEALAEEFIWLSEQMEQDDYVVGQAAFGLFKHGLWPRYELLDSPVLPRLGAYAQEKERQALLAITPGPAEP